MASQRRSQPKPDEDVGCTLSVSTGSDKAIVAFTGWGERPGRFGFFGLSKFFPEWNRLLVRDPSQNWYNTGLPRVGDTVDEIADRIRSMVDELGAKRTIAIGSSMGGYAAILFGCKIGADRAIALVPQTLLHPDLPIAPPADVSLQVPDLKPVVCDAPETKIDLIAAWDDLSDVFHARRIGASPSVRILAAPEGHSFARRLYKEGEYWPFITELIEGCVPRICEMEPPLETFDDERIEDTVFAGQRGEWEVARNRIAPVAERHSVWVAPKFHLGRAMVNLGEWRDAEVVLAEVVLARPRWRQAREELARALNGLGKPDEAESLVRDGLALDRQWWRGYLVLAECLLQLGRAEEARSAERRAERLISDVLADSPEFARGYLALGRLLVELGRPEEASSAAIRAEELNPALAQPVRELLARCSTGLS
jgi:pimeloyl-ACP methyl ester carboxylesterase